MKIDQPDPLSMTIAAASSSSHILAVFVVKVIKIVIFCPNTPKYSYLNLNNCMLEYFEKQILVPWGSPGVLWGPILGPNRGMFSKLNGPSPLGSGGYSYTSFSIGRFHAQWNSFGGDVTWTAF